MRKVSNRQRQILELLLSRQGEITAGEIADAIKVSTRTVHRELPEIESILLAEGLTLSKKSGVGIQLQAEPGQLEALSRRLLRLDTDAHTADERKVLILCRLLDSVEPIKLFTLSHELHVTEPTISADLDEHEDGLSKEGLTLVRRRGYGIQLVGPEPAKRSVIARLARDRLDDSDLFGKPGNPSPHPVTRKLLEMIGKSSFFRVEQAVWQLEEQWPTQLSEAAYTELLIRLSVAITRVRQGRCIKPGEYSAKSQADRETHSRLALFAELLELDLSPEESGYFADLLSFWKGTPSQELLLQDDMDMVETVVNLIRFVEERIKVPLLSDRSLVEGLLHHLKPALERIEQGEAIRNPLLAQIKRDFESLFLTVRQAVDRTIRGLQIPDEEIGYLVMHFGAALERAKQFSRHVRALIVCTSGIGSSKLLAARITKELPQIDIVGHASWFEAAHRPKEDYDLIISTVDLPVEADQYIKLSPLLTADETERLRKFIQTILIERPSSEQDGILQAGGTVDRLRMLKRYVEEMIRLLDRFEVYRLDGQRVNYELRDVITDICRVVQQAYGIEPIETVVSQLLARESYGSQVIPGTELALLHTRSDSVQEPLVALFVLNPPVHMGPEGRHAVTQALLMLAPMELPRESLEVLSEISAMLLLPEFIVQLGTADAETIRRAISEELEQFIQTKMEWRETK